MKTKLMASVLSILLIMSVTAISVSAALTSSYTQMSDHGRWHCVCDDVCCLAGYCVCANCTCDDCKCLHHHFIIKPLGCGSDCCPVPDACGDCLHCKL
ncbi:MAG: hypothetical protein LBB45_07940 [Methanobrevibacter sp.]|nr:hypothetical protein [Candidatus Methanovirga basalitermitum]